MISTNSHSIFLISVPILGIFFYLELITTKEVARLFVGFRPRIGDYFLSKEHVDLNLSKGIQRFRPRTGDYFFIPTLYSYDN